MLMISIINEYVLPIIEWSIFALTFHGTLNHTKRPLGMAVIGLFATSMITILSRWLLSAHIVGQHIVHFTLLIAIISVIYTAPLHIVAFYCVAVQYTSIITDLLVGNLYPMCVGQDISVILMTSPTHRLMFSLMAKGLQLVVIVLFINVFRKISWYIPKKYWLIMDAILSISYILTTAFLQINPFVQNIVSPAIIAVAVILYYMLNILVVALFLRISMYYINEKLQYATVITQASLESSIKRTDQERRELSKLRHDIQNNLSITLLLIRDKRIDEATRFIESLIDKIPEAAVQIYTSISSVDSLIAFKAEDARQAGINMSVECERISEPFVPPIELVTVIFNLLDNALEAARKIDRSEKHISFKLFAYKGALHVVVQNPHNSIIPNTASKFISSKKNAHHHGYGLEIVRDICEKNGGILLLEYSKSTFIAHATLLEKHA